MTEYNIGIVKGLREYLDVLKMISGENDGLPKQKYYQRQGIVAFNVEKNIDISKLVERLEERGWTLKTYKAPE